MDTLKLPQQNEILLEAFEYLDKGWSVIPIHPTKKLPFIKWK